MKGTREICVGLLLLGVSLLLVACSYHEVRYESHKKHGYGYGPPPHAPAHGYRHKMESGIEIEFDAGRGVYIVIGHPNHYYYKGDYLRLMDNHWEISASFKGSWKSVSESRLPPGLRRKDMKPPDDKEKPAEHPGRGIKPKKNKP